MGWKTLLGSRLAIAYVKTWRVFHPPPPRSAPTLTTDIIHAPRFQALDPLKHFGNFLLFEEVNLGNENVSLCRRFF